MIWYATQYGGPMILYSILFACNPAFEDNGTKLGEPSGEPGEPGEEVDPNKTDDDGDGYSEEQGDCDDTNSDLTPADFDGDGYSSCEGDCDDTNYLAFPGNHEDIPYDGIDMNCDGKSDFDVDGDGHDSATVPGGDDCDDSDPSRWEDCGMFIIETVDSACITCPGPNAIDVDVDGQPHIAYEDFSDIWYRFRDVDGNWSNYESLGTANAGTLRTDLGLDGKVDSGNNFQISYVAEYSGGQGVLYMYRDTNGSWSEEYEVDGPATTDHMTVGEGLSMDIDSNRKPSFSYFNADKRVPYLYDVDNSLVVDLLTDFEGINVPLDYDFSLVYSTLADYGISGFLLESGKHSSIVIDDQNNSHVVFHNYNTGVPGMGWAAPLIESFLGFDLSSLGESIENQYSKVPDWDGLQSMGLDTVTSALGGNISLPSGVCYGETVSEMSYAIHNSVAFNSTGDLYVAFYDYNTQDLKLAKKNSGSCSGWSVEDVDKTGDVGEYASLGFTSDDTPYIAYHDGSNGTLKVAYKANGAWEFEVVDGGNGAVAGTFADLAVGNDDRIHITYAVENDRNVIKYAVSYVAE
jgi:hypothetical protein